MRQLQEKYDNNGKTLVKKQVIGYISAKQDDLLIKEGFKSEVFDKDIVFPKDLGVEHPFSFEDMEKSYKSIGLISGAINKFTDSIVGDFSITSKDEKCRSAIKKIIKNTDFSVVLREWIREGLLKGNGFIEIDVKEKKITVVNANDMYVERNKHSKILGYNQWVGDFNKFKKSSKKLISFKPKQIAHLKINKISGEAYGIGIVFPNERVIENLIINDEDLHKLISRKAGAPIHVKVGIKGEATNPESVDEMKTNLQYMTNRTEWVSDANVEIDVIDFGEIGKNLTDIQRYDMEKLAFGMEIPIVLWGAGNIPEGLAKVHLESFQRKIASIQEDIESIVEEQIFRPLLEAEGLECDVEFTWNLPGETEINNRIEKLTKIIENFNVSENLRRMAEIEIAKLLNFEDASEFLLKPEKEVPKEEKEEEEVPIPEENPVIKKPVKEEMDMTVKEFVNLEETDKLNYSDYLVSMLRRLRVDKFEDIDMSLSDLNKLRNILKDGLRSNKTISKIQIDVEQSIELKDISPGEMVRSEILRLAKICFEDTHKE